MSRNDDIRRKLGFGMPTGRNTFANKPVGGRKDAPTENPALPAWLDGMEIGKGYYFDKDMTRHEMRTVEVEEESSKVPFHVGMGGCHAPHTGGFMTYDICNGTTTYYSANGKQVTEEEFDAEHRERMEVWKTGACPL